MRPLPFFLDGNDNNVSINEFHFASTAPNFIGFGLNLSLVDFFKVIQHPKFHWIWTKPRDALGNVSDRKTTLLFTSKAMKFAVSSFYVSDFYSWDWYMEISNLLQKYYVRLDVKRSATHCKGSRKITFGANMENLSLKGSHFMWEFEAKSFIPVGSPPITHLMTSIGSKFVF